MVLWMPELERRVCVFCGGSPLTREHIAPQWIKEFHPLVRPPLDPEIRARIPMRSIDGMGATTLAFIDVGPHQEIQDRTVKVVCANCNGGWMSALEVQMKRIYSRIRDREKFSLTEQDAIVIRRWAFKTALMLSRLSTAGLTETDDQFAALMEARVPEGVSVRIGKRTGWGAEPVLMTYLRLGIFLEPEYRLTVEEHLDATMPIGTATLIGLGPLLLIVRHGYPEFMEGIEAKTRFVAARTREVTMDLRWPSGLVGSDRREVEALVDRLRFKKTRIFDEESPDQLVLDESRRKGGGIFGLSSE